MRGVVIALALVACRPPSEAAPPEVTRPAAAPVQASVPPDPPPTVDPELFSAPVVAGSLERTAGGVQVKLRYFEVELANERARAGLARSTWARRAAASGRGDIRREERRSICRSSVFL